MLYKIINRIVDFFVAFLCILFFSPVLIIISLLIFIDKPKGPIFADIPKRVGYNGNLFFIYKFRSMIPNAHELIKKDPKFKELLDKHNKNQGKLKVEDDPRVTKIGRFIRKTDIDEMPQFFNVLIGNMSIVGPRAYYKDELEGYIKDYPEIKDKIDVVLTAKPGITGPWQVSGRNNLSIPERVHIDYEYAKRKSVLYDLLVMIRTPIAIITRLGAYE